MEKMFMPVKPFSLLIKPASADCNLRCTYCFYFDKYRLYPESSVHRMDRKTLDRVISSYMSTPQPLYAFGWQGGEPTIMGVEFFKEVVSLQQKYGKKGSVVSNGLQTNGTLLDDSFAKLLHEYNFLVGLSLDGPAYIHDKYRKDAGQEGTHHKVISAIDCLNRNKVEFNILTLVNEANVGHAKEVYNYLCDMGLFFHQYIPCVEFDEGGNMLPFAITGDAWGDFLCELFDEWLKTGVFKVSIRLFDSLLEFMMYGNYSTCTMAGDCRHYFVVEHNGDIYPCDFFVDPKLKLGNIMDTGWETFQNSSLYGAFGQQKNEWNHLCNSCPHLMYCSGDCLKHRIYAGNNPKNISWLCSGWKKFYDHAIPKLKELAHEIKTQNNEQQKLFCDTKWERNDPCFCHSGKKYKKCHGTVM
jgi:uncharacterized protein